MLNFVKAFPASMEIITWFLSFNLLIWYITLIDLCILKNPCFPGINPTWSWCMSFLMCCWILFSKILLRIFASMFIVILATIQFYNKIKLAYFIVYPTINIVCYMEVNSQNPQHNWIYLHAFVWEFVPNGSESSKLALNTFHVSNSSKTLLLHLNKRF